MDKIRIVKAFTLAAFIWPLVPAHEVYIIIHGTWGSQSKWAGPGGDFFETLEKQIPSAHVISYTWSGANTHAARVHAAEGLAKLICSFTDKTKITLLAHSHGANVGICTSQLLQKKYKANKDIAAFYALGVPVNTDAYTPNMQTITYFYNVFSFEDLVQPVGNLFGRTYPKHPRIANIRLFLNKKEPDHTQLHAPLLARGIPAIGSLIHAQNSRAEINNDISTPGILFITEKNNTIELDYRYDAERTILLERDRYINTMLVNAFARHRKQPIIFQPHFPVF